MSWPPRLLPEISVGGEGDLLIFKVTCPICRVLVAEERLNAQDVMAAPAAHVVPFGELLGQAMRDHLDTLHPEEVQQ